MSKTFYILRHALAVKKGEVYGERIFSARILAEGKPAIRRLADFIKNIPTDYNVTSEIIRCRQTAELITSITGKKFALDPRLNEYYQETFAELKNRVAVFLADVNSRNDQTFLICTHGAIIAVLKNLIVNGQCSEENLNDFPDPGVLLVIASMQISEHNFN